MACSSRVAAVAAVTALTLGAAVPAFASSRVPVPSKPRTPPYTPDPPAPTGRQWAYSYELDGIYCNVYRIVGTSQFVAVCHVMATGAIVDEPIARKPEPTTTTTAKPAGKAVLLPLINVARPVVSAHVGSALLA